MTLKQAKPRQEVKGWKDKMTVFSSPLGAAVKLKDVEELLTVECGNEMEVTWVGGLKPTKVVECDKCGKTAQVIRNTLRHELLPELNKL